MLSTGCASRTLEFHLAKDGQHHYLKTRMHSFLNVFKASELKDSVQTEEVISGVDATKLLINNERVAEAIARGIAEGLKK